LVSKWFFMSLLQNLQQTNSSHQIQSFERVKRETDSYRELRNRDREERASVVYLCERKSVRDIGEEREVVIVCVCVCVCL